MIGVDEDKQYTKISKQNYETLKKIINDTFAMSEELPDITGNILNTNINYRMFLLNEWINNPESKLQYGDD